MRRRSNEHRLGYHAVGGIMNAHAVSRLDPRFLQPRHERLVGIQFTHGFMSGLAEVGGARDHDRHGGIDA